MNSEHQILSKIEENNRITQRDIATSTGLSLGNVNILIKRLVKKGLVKIEKLNSRNIKYVLTPKGFTTIAEATYRYIVNSYRQISRFESVINEVIIHSEDAGDYFIYLMGIRDEIFNMLAGRLSSSKISWDHIEHKEELKPDKSKVLVITWQPEYSEILEEDIEQIDLLKHL